ncbi:MAG: hypothetical protein K1X51_13585 [Rhodospirillaceae bacterium]|nr:hypothetical protein [Rhodospirillaceae bacterium]
MEHDLPQVLEKIARRCRDRSDEVRSKIEAQTDPVTRQQLTDLADVWDELAASTIRDANNLRKRDPDPNAPDGRI